MYCHSCGKNIPESSKFCKYCAAPQKQGQPGGAQPFIEITPEKKFVKRSGHRVIFAMIFSFGLYFLYWINCTLHNLERVSGQNLKHDSVTLRMIIPIYNIFVYGEFLRNIKRLQDENQMDEQISPGTHQLLFTLGLFLFFPLLITMGVAQNQANRTMEKISGGQAQDAKFKWGEVLIISIGIIYFIITAINSA